MIFIFCGVVIIYIFFFGRLLCPDFDKGWSISEVNQHTGDDDFWVAVQGEVYDITNFWRCDHSDNRAMPVDQAMMKELAGKDLTMYFPVSLTRSCLDLVNNPLSAVQTSNLSDVLVLITLHTSRPLRGNLPTKLQNDDWHTKLPKMRNFHKGPLLVERKKVFQVATVDECVPFATLDAPIQCNP